MNQEQSNYEQLIEKLDQFIRKYYINKLIRGSLYASAVILGYFILINTSEYYFYFSSAVRKVMFYSFILSSTTALGYWLVNPAIRYFKLGKTISHDQAALIIGSHFEHVQDKLLNILQLKRMESSAVNMDLVRASIEQKTQSVKLVPFTAAINLNQNKKYLKYALPPTLLLLFLLLAAPGILREGSKRLIMNDVEFEREAPFQFEVDQKKLEVIQFEDYTLKVDVDGSVLPNTISLDVEGFPYQMEKITESSFTYTFKNVQKDIEFTIRSGTVVSVPYTLKVLKKPHLVNFFIDIDYPSYTGRKDETIYNLGDLTLPEGTKLTWEFEAEATDGMVMSFDGKSVEVQQRGNQTFRYSKMASRDELYKLYLSNNTVAKGDSLTYRLSVVKDQFPSISADKYTDSLDQNLVYFIGNAADDYGLQTLSFNYQITKENGQQNPVQSLKLDKEEGREINFSHAIDLKKLNLLPGDQLSFYFEVADNDGVNGSKKTKSTVLTMLKPTVEQLKKEESQNDQAIKDELKDALKAMDEMQENFRKMKEKLLQQKQMEWQDKKQLEKLLDQQNKLQEQLKKAKEKLDENIKKQEDIKDQPEEIKEEQKKLQELFEKAMNPETQELMEKIKELLQELEKEDAVQMLEQFEMNNESFEKEMERMLELYKQLEVEKLAKDQIKALEKLAEEQEKLSEKTEKKDSSQDELKKEQDEINKKFDELQKKMEELEKKNDELKKPEKLGEENKEKMEDIEKDLDKSKDQLGKNDKQNASKSQKKASKKMKQAASDMKSSMNSGDQEQAQEDIKTLRQLLENLVNLSFDEENLIKTFQTIQPNTPSYVKSIQQQFKLKGDFKAIEDTLVALSNRNSDIEGFVMDKVSEIKFNFKESITQLEERQQAQGIEKQRRIMKNVNDLSLMLSESLENAQKQAAQGMPGAQMCDSPGGKKGQKSAKVPMDKISDGQEQLGKDLQKMKEKQGKGKDGNSAKEYAEAAARQAALRKALQELQKDKKEQGKGSKELDDIINNMDKVETDLVNKRLNSETLNRMQDIETRLLEAEKSERQRELDQKRMSETAQNKNIVIPPSLQEYLKKRQAETEMYKTVSPALKPYYKSLVDDYYKSLKSSK